MSSSDQFFGGIAEHLKAAAAADWRRQARPNQLPPPGDWRIWLLLAGRGFGKALALDTPIPTPRGWLTMGELRAGDVALDENEAPTTVLEVHPVLLGRPCYRVSFTGGAAIVTDADHLWTTLDGQNTPRTLTTEQICASLRAGEEHALPGTAARGRRLVAVDPAPSVPVRCITVDSPSRLYLAGREMIATHNTRTIMEFVRAEVSAGRASRVAFVAATSSDARDVLVTGHSGILAISPTWDRPEYQPTKRLVAWKNGAIATLYSADEPDRLRGPQFDLAVCDELAAWRYPEALDMLLLGLRIGRNPRLAIATTPRPTKVIRGLLAREGKDVVVTRGSTLENRDHLAPAYVEQILDRYRGTRLERQEVFGEVLEDVPGALWSRETLERTRVAEAPPMQRIVVAIDPGGGSGEGSDETGIVVAGLGQDGQGYVLDDVSGRYDPAGWARAAIGAYHVWRADKIVVERNFGGDMAAATLESIDPNVPVKEISSSRGKVLRAEPIAALFEQGRAHFVGTHTMLEDQACRFTSAWSREKDGSPDRIDAMVFALTELMLGLPAGGYIKAPMLLEQRQGAREPVEMPESAEYIYASAAGCVADPDSIGVVYFAAQHPLLPGAQLIVIDWELQLLEPSTLAGWPLAVCARCIELAGTCHGAPGGLIVEAAGIGRTLREHAERLSFSGEWQDDPDEELLSHPVLCQQYMQTGSIGFRFVIGVTDEEWAALPSRIVRAAGHVAAGRVQLARPAFEKLQSFKAVSCNHFLSQVTAFGLSQDASATGELLAAFANGACAKFERAGDFAR